MVVPLAEVGLLGIILIIIVIVLLFGGIGYGRGRW